MSERWFVGDQFLPCPLEHEKSPVNISPTTKRRRFDDEDSDGEDNFFYDDINSDVEDDEMNFIYFDSYSEGSSDSCSDYED